VINQSDCQIGETVRHESRRWTSTDATPARELVPSTPVAEAATSSFDVPKRDALS
jgi:hypothetical protein